MRKNQVFFIERMNQNMYLPVYETISLDCNSGPCPSINRGNDHFSAELEQEKVPYGNLMFILTGNARRLYTLVYASLEN